MTINDRKLFLTNVAAQKVVAIANVAMNLQLQGYDALTQFCELTHLQAILDSLRNSELSLSNLEEITELLSEIGEKMPLSYRPLLEQLVIEVKADPAVEIGEIKDDVSDLTNQVNYVPPTLLLTTVGFNKGIHEIGVGTVIFDVNWNANKIPLEWIDFILPDEGNRGVQGTIGTLPAVTLNFLGSEPLEKTILGRYNDREPFKGQHLLAQASLYFRTVWPCYWGAGPVDALNASASEINLFAISLNRELECKSCIEAVLAEGEVLYFFFPYSGKHKQFTTSGGLINNSFKGTVEEFQTQSQINKNDLGKTTYGVIRSDQAGIGLLKVCVQEAEWPEAVVVEVPVIPTDIIEYDGVWTKLVCVQDGVTYESIWTNSVCAKEEIV